MVLTHRDHTLFKNLSSYGMLTTKQITEINFRSIARTTVLRRLRVLEEASYIKRVIGLESQETLWVLTEKGANMAEVVLAKRHWSKNLLEHDYKLLSIRLELEKCGIAQSWIPEHQIRSLIIQRYGISESKKRLIPDGLMNTELSRTLGPVAIEIELTLKNQQRIHEIIKRYQQKKDLHAVWYISTHEAILKSIFREWHKYKDPNNRIQLLGSIYEDVISNSLEARLWTEKGFSKISDVLKPRPAHPPAQGVSTFMKSLNQTSPILSFRNHNGLSTS